MRHTPPFLSINFLPNLSLGAEDKAATSSNGKWCLEVCGPRTVFPVDQGRGRIGRALWWLDAAPNALRSIGYYHLGSIRIRVEVEQVIRQQVFSVVFSALLLSRIALLDQPVRGITWRFRDDLALSHSHILSKGTCTMYPIM